MRYSGTHGHSSLPRTLAFSLCCVGTVFLLGWLTLSSRHGFDFTDEGYYLVWMAHPWRYDWSVSQFGFVYHPLYWLLDGNIALLRQANVFLTFGLAWLMCAAMLRLVVEPSSLSRLDLGAVSAALATSGLAVFHFGLITPSYNSLTMQALLACGAGMAWVVRENPRQQLWGALLIGLGGALAFLAKPSTAVVLGGCVAAYLVLARALTLRVALAAVGSAAILLVISALLIDGSIAAFVERLKIGVEYSRLSGAGYSMGELLRIDPFPLSTVGLRVLSLVTAVLLLVCLVPVILGRIGQMSAIFFSVTCLVFLMMVIVGDLRAWPEIRGDKQFWLWVVPCAALATAVSLACLGRVSRLAPPVWAAALCFVVFPFAYAFGTNGNYWMAGGAGLVFWVLAAVMFLASTLKVTASWAAFLPLAMLTQLGVALLLQESISEPYRQPQRLWEQQRPTSIGSGHSRLLVSHDYGGYVEGLVSAARKAGFKPGQPLIDLTGHSPGVLYALDALSVGYPWVAGGYPGSGTVASLGFERFSCENLADAWVLIELEGPRALELGLLRKFGLDPEANYGLAAAWRTPTGFGGYAEQREQQLLRPEGDRQAVLESCQRAR